MLKAATLAAGALMALGSFATFALLLSVFGVSGLVGAALILLIFFAQYLVHPYLVLWDARRSAPSEG